MTARPFRARVHEIRHLTPKIREMTLEMIEPSSLSFRSGQSIAVTVPGRSSNSPFVRYFSLVSSPRSASFLVLLLDSQDRGKGSTFLLEKDKGAEVQISGPYGSFMLQHEEDQDLLFIGTGTGVAPLWSMIGTLLEGSCTQPIKLLWGLRSEVDRYYLRELEAWKTQYENFSYVLTLSQPSTTWRGKQGRVTDLLQELSMVAPTSAYICGNLAMVKEVYALLKKKGARAIYRERHMENL